MKGADNRSHEPTHTATFSIGRASLAGVRLPTGTPADLASSIATINAVTGRLGIQVRLPQVVPNGPYGVAYTPLTLALGGHTAYGKALYPFLAGTNDYSVVSLFLNITQPTIFDPAHCEQLGGVFKVDKRLNFTWNYLGATDAGAAVGVRGGDQRGRRGRSGAGGVLTTVDDTYYPQRTAPAKDLFPRRVGAGRGG